jgi:signal transduction histidine kinase/ligand-binding sensor domain-containing protein
MKRLGAALAGMLLAWHPCAVALNPALDVSQYAHTAWKIREGFSKGMIFSIAQTPDGYLWLGTEFGLLRFDGVRTVPWPPPDQHLPSSNIWSLLAARDGTLWIGTIGGLASWKGGKLTPYSELAGQRIFSLLEDREGMVWVGGNAVGTGRVCSIQKGSVRCYEENGRLSGAVVGLYEDSKGYLWAGALNGLWRWKPGPPKFFSMPGELDALRGFAETDDGALLIGTRGGIKRLINGNAEAYRLPGNSGKFYAQRLLRDRQGSLWMGTDRGVVHVHQGTTDVFARSDGLSGDRVSTLFEDREGNIWAATNEGLDRFRDFAVATISVNEGLSNATVGSVLAARDGSIWLGTRDGLNRWNHGQVSVFGRRGARARTGMREIAGSGLPDHGIESLFQDDRGRIWVSTLGGVGFLENERFISVSGIPSGFVHAIAEDTAGILWFNHDHGLLRLSGSEVQQIPWAKLGHKGYATDLAADPLKGGLWIGFSQDGVAYLKDGRAAAVLREGHVNTIRFDRDGTLWAATQGGLIRLKDAGITTITSKNGLPCDAVYWMMEDDDRSFWLYMPCGLARIARQELDAWAADPNHALKATLLDISDGVRTVALPGGYSPRVAKSPDGKLWFTGSDGVNVVDPRHLPSNSLPPPVHIEQITADRKLYDANAGLRLPPLIRDLQIDYTALSLAAPEKVLFRYKLEGHDRDWVDAGTRRQAFYSDLRPRNYRFRVMACNNSGVWNEAGDFLDFSVDPAYYQTRWFQGLCVAAFLALLGGLYRLRLRQLAWQFNMRLEERVAERTRIARDLHDTLLQSFQGVLMKLSVVAPRIKDSPEAQQQLETIVDQARQAVTEGRDAVQGLRSSTVVTNDLARAINALAEELAARYTNPNCPEFHLRVVGESRDLAPIVRDDVHRIACEAVRNAFRHAQAGRIEVEIHYERRQLRLRVRDDGKGIDQKILGGGGRPGHFGLAGMQERAKLVGGKLTVISRLEAGTEAELTIPASLAYAKASAERRSMSSGGGG